jgi:hypothetical protein
MKYLYGLFAFVVAAGLIGPSLAGADDWDDDDLDIDYDDDDGYVLYSAPTYREVPSDPNDGWKERTETRYYGRYDWDDDDGFEYDDDGDYVLYGQTTTRWRDRESPGYSRNSDYRGYTRGYSEGWRDADRTRYRPDRYSYSDSYDRDYDLWEDRGWRDDRYRSGYSSRDSSRAPSWRYDDSRYRSFRYEDRYGRADDSRYGGYRDRYDADGRLPARPRLEGRVTGPYGDGSTRRSSPTYRYETEYWRSYDDDYDWEDRYDDLEDRYEEWYDD